MIIKKCLKYLYESIRGYIAVAFEMIFLEKPWYLFPLRFLSYIMLIVISIANVEIRLWPRKFKSMEDFYRHVGTITKKLYENNQTEWAGEIYGALYVSQSFYEMQGELLRVLPQVRRQKFCKDLKLTKDINKAISFLNSFSKGVI